MPALLIAEIRDITDPERYEDYKKIAQEAIAAFGGTYLVRGGAVETLEGSWEPGRMVVLQFDSMEQLKAFHSSEMYAPGLALRTEITTSTAIAVETL